MKLSLVMIGLSRKECFAYAKSGRQSSKRKMPVQTGQSHQKSQGNWKIIFRRRLGVCRCNPNLGTWAVLHST